MNDIVNTVVINNIERRQCSRFDREVWGKRLIACYRVTMAFNDKKYEFCWALAGEEKNVPCPEPYDEEEFGVFLSLVREGASWRKTKKFVWAIQESICTGIHYQHTEDESIAMVFPLEIHRYKYVKEQ